MNKTVVVNLNTSPYDIYMGRSTYQRVPKTPGVRGFLGNPNTLQEHGRFWAVELYKYDFYRKLRRVHGFKDEVLTYQGKRLGCYCTKKQIEDCLCHAVTVAVYIDTLKIWTTWYVIHKSSKPGLRIKVRPSPTHVAGGAGTVSQYVTPKRNHRKFAKINGVDCVAFEMNYARYHEHFLLHEAMTLEIYNKLGMDPSQTSVETFF